MIKVTRKVEYSLMAIKLMASRPKEELTSAREVCDKFSIPFDTISKVMQSLKNSGVITAVQGAQGGHFISKDLNRLSYLELNEIVEEKKMIEGCNTKNKKCSRSGQCNISNSMNNLHKKLLGLFKNISVHELLKLDENYIIGILETNRKIDNE